MRQLLIALASVSITQAAYSLDTASTLTRTEDIKGQNIYARLAKESDGWRIKLPLRLSPQAGSENEIDVLLNSLSPAGVTSNARPGVRILCIPIGSCSDEYDKNPKRYKTREDAEKDLVRPWSGPFMASELNVGQTLLNNTLGLLVSMGTAAGNTSKTYTFDTDAFNSALAEALNSAGMSNEHRKAIVDGYSRLKQTNAGLIEKYKKEFEIAQRDYLSPRIKLDYKISNLSGFKDASDSNYGVFVMPQVSQPVWPKMFGMLDRVFTKYLAEGGTNLEDRISEIGAEYSALSRQVRGISSNSRRVTFLCRDDGSYVLDVNCPNAVDYLDKDRANVEVPIRVLAKRNVRIGFPVLEGKDKAIATIAGPRGVYLTNQTSEFIQVDTVSLYWGSKVSTLSDLKIELAPNTTTEVPISLSRFNSSFLTGHQPVVLPKVTMQELSKLLVKVGLAIKYVVVDTNKSKTLFIDKRFDGHELSSFEVPSGWL